MLGDRHRVSGAAGDSNPRFQTKPTGSLRPLRRSEPPPRPLPTSPGAAPSLTHRPGRGWPRRAPSSRRKAGAGAGRKGPPSRFPAGSLAGRWRAWVPGGWSWGGGRRRHRPKGRPRAASEPGAEAGTGREPALLQSRGLNRALGANHSVGGGGGVTGGWAGRGGDRLPHSPLPPPAAPPPRRRGAFHPLPRELHQPGSGVEQRERAGSAVGPGAHPS